MFSNVGWGEILVLLLLGLILIGPERLPELVKDVRALAFAARRAIEDARETLDGEFGGEFDEIRKPLQEFGDLRRLNPRTAITRTLFDGDDTYLDLLTGKPAAGGGGAAGSAGAARRTGRTPADGGDAAGGPGAAEAGPAAGAGGEPGRAGGEAPGRHGAADGSSWVDDDVL
ncbi:hypothetical protein [Corynebacterium sphenisci]|uniref:hypothetical protein n=1 Tax=Corynebacterium sphenisci TaxID=191493 RepID=UPI003183FC9F